MGTLSVYFSQRLLAGESSAWVFGMAQGLLWLVRKVVANFLLQEAGHSSIRTSTETRVRALSPRARKDFLPYWRVIYPGSALIRRMWLRAVKRRAERAT